MKTNELQQVGNHAVVPRRTVLQNMAQGQALTQRPRLGFGSGVQNLMQGWIGCSTWNLLLAYVVERRVEQKPGLRWMFCVEPFASIRSALQS